MLVSVLINNYNYGRFLDYCIQSVLNQTYENVEVILYDDGSTDDSLEVAKRYKDRVKLLSCQNYGKGHVRNQSNAIYQAFRQSSGEIVCLLDSDDAFFSNKIQNIVDHFQRSKDLVMVQHPFSVINKQNEKTGEIRPLLKQTNISSYVQQSGILEHLFTATSGLSFKRRFLEKVLPLQEDDYHLLAPDYRLSVLSLLYGGIVTIHQPLAEYRLHEENYHLNILGNPKEYNLCVEQMYRFYNREAEKRQQPLLAKPTETMAARDSIFRSFMDTEVLYRFIESHKEDEFVIWGAGEAGKSVYYELKKVHVSVSKFIDKDPRKNGTFVNGCPVSLPDQTEWRSHKFVIASYFARKEIERFLLSKGVDREDILFPFKINNFEKEGL